MLLALLVALLLTTLCVSRYYSTTPLHVVRVLLRLASLKAIELAVLVYAPARRRAVSTGPTFRGGSEGWAASREALLQLLTELFPGQRVTVDRFEGMQTAGSRYPFSYQPIEEERLLRLRDKWGIEAVVRPGQDDFSRITALSNWVHSQWQHGTSGAAHFDPVAFCADDILTAARHGAQFWCHVYATTFIQLASSIGLQARLVSLTKDGYDTGDRHAVAEAWSDFHRKWIAIDTDFNLWYARDGVPLSVLEVHESVLAGEVDALAVVKGEARPAPEFERRIPDLFAYYRYFELDLRNDWLSNRYFPGHPARSDRATLFWKDRRLPPVLTAKTKSDRAEDLYWELNAAALSFSGLAGEEPALAVRIATVTPNFSHFQLAVDETDTVCSTGGEFDWRLHTGRNSLSVLPVNQYGRTGRASRLTVLLGTQ